MTGVSFLFSPLPCLDTGSVSLLATSSNSDTVSLLMGVVGMGVPLMGVLKALALLTSRLVNSADRAVSLTLILPVDK